MVVQTGWQREIGERVTIAHNGCILLGVITDKRVAYGGYVKLYVEVPSGFEVYGMTRFSCIITEKDIV
jgi:hypothetical protein